MDEKKGLITVDLAMRMNWTDPRVKGLQKTKQTFVTFYGDALKKFWIPDAFFDLVSTI